MRPAIPAALTAILLALPASARAQTGAEPWRAHEILVDLRDELSDTDVRALDDAYASFELRLNSPHARDERLYVADFPVQTPEALHHQGRVIERLRADPRVEYAEPNWVYHLIESTPVAEVDAKDASDAEPQRRLPAEVDDPFFAKQWSFPQIGVPQAWAHADGEGVVVGVIDTGVAFEDRKRFRRVEDLAADGFVEGYDFLADDDHPNDDHGHGTHVAGTIAQMTNNGVGVAGIAPKAKIMPLKVLSKRGAGTAGDIADAIRFAADEGANIVNLSLGGGPRSLIMEAAVRYARTKGVLVVCAAGNGARNRVEFPAAYVGSFAVSSVGPDGKLAYYSSYGRQIDVAAPGGNKQLGEDAGILQNTITPIAVDKRNTYLSFQGTSMAAPHVAGVAALVMSTGLRDVTEVEKILRKTATDAGSKGWDERYGYGVVNAERAVSAARTRAAAMASRGWTRMPAALERGGSDRVEVARTRSVEAAALPTAGVHIRRALEALVLAFGWIGLILIRGGRRWLKTAGPLAALGVLLGVGLAASPGIELLRTAPWQSVLPALGAAVLFLHVRRLRPVLFGLTAGWAVMLAVQIPALGADVAGIPGQAGLLDRAWLLLQTGLLVVLTLRLAQLTRTDD